MKHSPCLATAAIVLAARVAAAQALAETTFPFESWNARAVATGSVGTAGRGLEFLMANPAAAAGARAVYGTRNAANLGSVDIELAAAHSIPSLGTIAISLRRRDWGQVAADLGIEDLSVSEQSAVLGYAGHPFLKSVAVGATAALLDANYLGTDVRGWAFDVGAQARIVHRLSLGAALLHLGPGMGSPPERTPLPKRARFGATWEQTVHGVNVAALADVALPLRGPSNPDVFTGTEVGLRRGLLSAAARAGLQRLAGTGNSWAAGGSVGVGHIRMDIARSGWGTLVDTKAVSLALFW